MFIRKPPVSCVSNENHRASCQRQKCRKTSENPGAAKTRMFGYQAEKQRHVRSSAVAIPVDTRASSIQQQHQWPCTVKLPSLRKRGSLPTRRLRFDFSHSAALLGSIMRAALQSARHNQCNPPAFTSTLHKHCNLQTIFADFILNPQLDLKSRSMELIPFVDPLNYIYVYILIYRSNIWKCIQVCCYVTCYRHVL